MANSRTNFAASKAPPLAATIDARVVKHDRAYSLSTLFFNNGELRVPLVDAPIDAGVRVRIDARDVSIALSRPMDVSITNRLPGAIVELKPLSPPFVRVTFNLGGAHIYALVTNESVERLALEPGLAAWAMIKSVAIDEQAILPAAPPKPRRWRVVQNPD